MWSNDDLAIEELIRAAEPMPRLTGSFRQQVLVQAVHAKRRSDSVQRVQTLTTMLLAVALFVFLPGYYHRAQAGGVPITYSMAAESDDYPSFSRIATASMAVAQPLLSNDAFESSLIEAELAVKVHSARAFGAAL